MRRLHEVTFWAGVWYGTHDFLYLVDGGGPGEQGFPQQHLSQDTAKAPHVHTFSVSLDKKYSPHSLVQVPLIFPILILSLELKHNIPNS